MPSFFDLKPEQQAAATRIFEHDRTFLIAPLGFGKAVVALTALQELIDSGAVSRVLVIAPLRVITMTWATEIAKWDHLRSELFVSVAESDEKGRRRAMEGRARVVMINLESAHHMINDYGDEFDGLLIDELTRLKTSGGTLFRLMRNWVKRLKWRCGMTATPVAQCTSDIYGQTLLLDDGLALGKRKDAFIDRYFYTSDYSYDVELRPGAAAEIAAKMKNLLYIADGSSYLAELPALNDLWRAIPIESDTDGLYEEMQAEGVTMNVIAPNAAVRAMKLGQIAAGGLYGPDEKLVYRCHRRLDLTRDIIASIVEPTVVVYNYTFERDALQGIPTLGGGGSATPADVEAFNQGKLRVIAGHPRSLGQGLNLQGACRRMLVLSPILSADMNQQVVGRIHRRGQKHDCTRTTLYTPETIHEHWRNTLMSRRATEAATMTALTK